MLTVTSNPHLSTKQAPTRVVTGQHLAKAHRTYSAWQRTEDAIAWLEGELQIRPTVKLACATFGISYARLKQAQARLEQRNKRRGNGGSTTLSDAVIDRIVTEVGPDRILHALDRVTSPELPLQAAE